MKLIKTARQMERHLKGIANHHRIEILFFIAKNSAATLEEIVRANRANPKTIGEHTRRLHQAGLISKKNLGRFVQHTLSPYGRTFVRFLNSFQKS